MRPTINFKFQTCSCLPIVCNNWSYNNCSIVPSLFHFTVVLVFYITAQNFTKHASQVSVNFSKVSKAELTPVLFNKIWYYRMLQKLSQVVSEQILTLYFKCQSFSSNHLFQCCSKGPVMKWCVFSLLHSQSEAGGLWPLLLKTRQDPRGLYIVSLKWSKPTNKSINLIALTFS